jgi:hypothetical protein
MSRSIRILYTLFLCALIPVYLHHYPLANFLWFSDIAMLITAAALWLQSSLLASMMALSVLLPEIIWNISFFASLIFGIDLFGMTAYMFDPRRPLYLRALSLFHVALPVLLLWMLRQFGYHRRAWFPQIILAWLVLPISYVFTTATANINWVLGPAARPQHRLPPLIYLAIEMILIPILIYLPTHLILAKFFRNPNRSPV